MKFETMHHVFAPRSDERLLERSDWRDWSDLQAQAIRRFNDAITNGSIDLEEVDVCLCGSDYFLPISRVDRFSIQSPTKLCLKCGLILTSPRISASSISEYYETHYPSLLSSEKSADELQHLHSEAQGEKVHSYIREAMAGRASLKILDYGAGLGDVSSYIRERFMSLGVEVEIFAIESNSRFKQELLKQDISIISEQDLDNHQGSFDLIILSHIIEHIHDFHILLRRLRQTLNKAGRIYIEVPGVLSIHKKENYMFSYTGYAIHAHLYNFSLASLCFHVVQQGFNVLSSNEDVQLLLAADSYSWYDFGPRRKQLRTLQNSAKTSVTVITNYLRCLEDLGPQLNSLEDCKRKLSVAERKLENFNHFLRIAEISINSKLNALGSPIEDPEGYLDNLDISERYPLKEWLLDAATYFEHDSEELVLASSVFIRGMQVHIDGFIRLKALENDCYIYTPQSQDFELVLKPGQDVKYLSIRSLQGEEVIQFESTVVFKLHAGLNRIHLSVQAFEGSTQSYTILLKPVASSDTGLRNFTAAEALLNNKLETLESPIKDPEGYLDELELVERCLLKEWLLDSSIHFERDPDEIDLESVVFIKGRQVLTNGFIHLTALENDCYIYALESQGFKLIIKPGQGIERISIRTVEGEENIRTESPVVLKLHAGLNRVHLSARVLDDSARAYAVLVKPVISDDTGRQKLPS